MLLIFFLSLFSVVISLKIISPQVKEVNLSRGPPRGPLFFKPQKWSFFPRDAKTEHFGILTRRDSARGPLEKYTLFTCGLIDSEEVPTKIK
jgi:hypothetical protein